jgi:hypothetical protein
VPPFAVLLTSGETLRVPQDSSLPLVVFSVDSDEDPGGVILATDAIEIDRMLSTPPPAGTILFVSQSMANGGADLQGIYEARLALLPAREAAAWRASLAFAAQSLDAMRAAGSALAGLLDSWQSPRLWVTAPPPGQVAVPRVDGFYECFMWPPAQAEFPLVGPFTACDPLGLNGTAVPQGSLLLVTNASAQGGACDAGAAAAWAQVWQRWRPREGALGTHQERSCSAPRMQHHATSFLSPCRQQLVPLPQEPSLQRQRPPWLAATAPTLLSTISSSP